MKDQHTLIKGYRDLSQDEIDLINEIKKVAERVRTLIEDIDNKSDCNHRWLEIGTIDLQKGFMCLVRSVAKPDSF